MMKFFKVKKSKFATILSLVLCASILFCGNVFAAEESVEISEPTGYTLNSDGEIVPYIDRQTSVTITDKSYAYATSNTPAFNEEVNVTIDALSKNISSVMIEVEYHGFTIFRTIYSSELKNGDTFTFNIPALYQYFVSVKVVSGDVSLSNPGTVTLTVSDK